MEKRSTREEIREGIKEVLSGWGIDNWDIDHSAIDDLLNYLHSQGVVIKIDRKLPFVSSDFTLSTHGVYVKVGEGALSEQGYVAVESLVKEE